MTMTRRSFQSGVLIALCGAVLLGKGALAAPTVAPKYRHRLRFLVQRHELKFWLRVANTSDISSDVRFKLLLSSDPRGMNSITTLSHVSSASASHIVRGSVRLDAHGWKPNSPLFGQLVFDEGRAATKIRAINAAAANLT